ncbi:unnamed protein product [Cylindrotheca closterium]|uniref:Uncharacterized protein n=1 Tax=Cylindrotheca closterium TaxID=2856 RepID=A0AAD2G450_9STRA|nr:unnamed protein product [Cylindrotheca closterium]
MGQTIPTIEVANTNLGTVASPTRSFLTMGGHKDGKKKRKGKAASSTSSQSVPAATPTPTPAAPRVSNDINVSIRRQIQYGKLNKKMREGGTAAFRQKKVARTKYRRAWDEEEIEQKAEERRRKGQDPDWDVILNRTSTPPLVIVDGYNIIYKWPRLKKHMSKNDPARARQLLVDDLENMRSIKSWRIEVVFDGAGKDNRNGPLGQSGQRRISATDQKESKDVSKHGVRVVFTGTGVEADSYIEGRCLQAKNVTKGELTGSLIVATDDAMIRSAGTSAGAMCMGADRFVSELKAIKKAVAFRVEVAMAQVNGERMRPEKLWGTTTFAPTNTVNPANLRPLSSSNTTKATESQIEGIKGLQQTEDGRTVYTGRFGRNAVIIEDRRKKKKK